MTGFASTYHPETPNLCTKGERVLVLIELHFKLDRGQHEDQRQESPCNIELQHWTAAYKLLLLLLPV